MKKITRISVPRQVVLPLAAAAFLAACDDHPPSTYKTTNVNPSRSRDEDDDAEPGRAAAPRSVERRSPSKIKVSMQRGTVKVHHVV